MFSFTIVNLIPENLITVKSSRENNMHCRKSLLWIVLTFKTEENDKKFAHAFFGRQTQIRLTSSLDCIAVLQFERYQALFWHVLWHYRLKEGCCNTQGTQLDDWKQRSIQHYHSIKGFRKFKLFRSTGFCTPI